jgi:xylulokinase
VSGGGERSKFWRQMQADIYGRKVVTINAEEGPAFGVALLAAAGTGAYKDVVEACTKTIRVVKSTATNAKNRKRYDQTYPIYGRLYRSLKEDFHSIADLVE